MLPRSGVLLVTVGYFVLVQACVSADVYHVKEQEVQTLLRANESMQEQNRSLIADKTGLSTQTGEMKKENEKLKERIEAQAEEIVYLKNRAEKLEKDGDRLRDRMEKLTAKIAELDKENQRLASLNRPENLLRNLGEQLGDLQKQVEALSGENEKLKARQVLARSKEVKTGASEGEKQKPVVVSAGQTATESKLPLSDGREKLSDNP